MADVFIQGSMSYGSRDENLGSHYWGHTTAATHFCLAARGSPVRMEQSASPLVFITVLALPSPESFPLIDSDYVCLGELKILRHFGLEFRRHVGHISEPIKL
jgi:hypothetical protein